jgi:hypothetical protein
MTRSTASCVSCSALGPDVLKTTRARETNKTKVKVNRFFFAHSILLTDILFLSTLAG